VLFATLGTQLDVGVETLEEEEDVALMETVDDETVNVDDVTVEFAEVNAELLVGL